MILLSQTHHTSYDPEITTETTKDNTGKLLIVSDHDGNLEIINSHNRGANRMNSKILKKLESLENPIAISNPQLQRREA